MKLVVTTCADCQHEQEDLITRASKPEYEPCEKCGSKKMSEVDGDIRPFSSQRYAKNPGAGPWG